MIIESLMRLFKIIFKDAKKNWKMTTLDLKGRD